MCKIWKFISRRVQGMTNNSQTLLLVESSCSEVTLCMYIDGNIGHCRWVFTANEYRCALSSADFTVDRRRK